MENTIKLREGLEISNKITVLSWDRISLIYNKYNREEIGEIQLTLEIIKLLLIDKTKIQEVDDILEGELTENFIAELTDWGEKIMTLITGFIEAKKK